MADTIRSMAVHIVSLPVQAVHSHGSGDVSRIDTCLLELTSEDGIVGWGEAAPWTVFTGSLEAAAAALDKHFRDIVIGADASRPEAVMVAAERILVGANEAKAALETALLDIQGQRVGLPIAELLGGRHRQTLGMSISIANPDFDADLDDIARFVEEGISILKLKTGFADHAFDKMRLEKLRALYSDGLDLRIDYNQGLRPHQARQRLRELESFGLSFIEQPVPRADRAALAILTQSLDTPILADESVFDAREALLAAQNRIADLFSLKIMKSGGLRRALEVAAIARAAGIGVYGGCMFETGIAHAAGSHLMAAVPDLELGCEFYMANYYLHEDILTQPFPAHGGVVTIPTAPGLGVQVNRDKLQHYRVGLLS